MRNPPEYQSIITWEPGKRSGKPCIRGMRITFYDVLEYLASGMPEQEVLDNFPDLKAADIQACLRFAADPKNGPDSVEWHRQWQEGLDIDRFFDEVFGPGSRSQFQN